MPSCKWNAYRYLNIISRDSGETTCAAKNKFGKRCRWDISPRRVDKLRFILNDMETKRPNDTTDVLHKLALLSICEEQHWKDYQKVLEVICEWEAAIVEAEEEYKKHESLRIRNRLLESQFQQEVVARKDASEYLSKSQTHFTKKGLVDA